MGAKKGFYDVKNYSMCYLADSAADLYKELFDAITKTNQTPGGFEYA